MDLNEFFDNVIAELEDEGARERSLKRTSAVAQGRFKRTLKSLLASRIDAMTKTGTGSPCLRTVEFSDNGEPEKVRLRVHSQRLSKSYRRTITVSDGELDLETVRDKAEELAEQVKEKLKKRKSFRPELGTIGEYLMEEKGYSRQTAWLHENYEDRAEKAGFSEYGRVKAVESYSTKPFRFKVKMEISSEHWGDESELEAVAREKALDMFPEARATDAFVKTGINFAFIRLTID
jgi:hypothetical protein